MVAASSVEIRAVDKFYGPFHALKDIDLSIAPGKVTCLIGPSGSGKSTLLRCINFLEVYDKGEIRIDGQLIGYKTPGGPRMPARDLRAMRRSIGMVFQQFNLWPHMTALAERRRGPPARPRPAPRRRRGPRRRGARQGRPRRQDGEPPLAASPAASSSAWRSPAPSPWSRS